MPNIGLPIQNRKSKIENWFNPSESFIQTTQTNSNDKHAMRARIDNQVVLIHSDDVPTYKKGGSVVRNTYFWALRAIAGYAPREGDWEYESEVWVALKRVLMAFTESGYLGLSETLLEFPPDTPIPPTLRSVSTWSESQDTYVSSPYYSHAISYE